MKPTREAKERSNDLKAQTIVARYWFDCNCGLPCCCCRNRTFRLCNFDKYSARWIGSSVCKWACVWASNWISWRCSPGWLAGHGGLNGKIPRISLINQKLKRLWIYKIMPWHSPSGSDELWLSWKRHSWLLLLMLLCRHRLHWPHTTMLRRLIRCQNNLILHMHLLHRRLTLHHSTRTLNGFQNENKQNEYYFWSKFSRKCQMFATYRRSDECSYYVRFVAGIRIYDWTIFHALI